MGAYTSLHVVPSSDPEWTPDEAFIRDVYAYFGATEVWAVTEYPVPLYWEDMSVACGRAVYRHWHTTLDEALRHLAERSSARCPGEYRASRRSLLAVLARALRRIGKPKAVLVAIGITCGNWSNRLCASHASIPESVTEGYCPCDVFMKIGPFSIPSREFDSTIGKYCFEVSLGGDGLPVIDWAEYLAMVRQDPVITELIAFLHEHSGKEWDVLMSSSY